MAIVTTVNNICVSTTLKKCILCACCSSSFFFKYKISDAYVDVIKTEHVVTLPTKKPTKRK